ncbi:MAG: 16S rRNA (adenine(1518)-N(6)/adenine(1519)-N(6))-dimethyltransferase RsmA [Alphaproteobacteria bacterium]|jgi:16S rRNA (adenine1518-N6/adenine1519-N6)-dimethyltransferase|nr:16S rRNA (adenine(1518)-N(6)/adenine(1519)-N(6))-dimethyltransferase RsmA [Alphaproteobacteria bacterium]
MPTLPPLREIIARHSLRAQKTLGQHFLLDSNLTQKIVRQAGPLSGVNVVEIGPGPGGLTRAILDSDAATLTAIEMDARCLPALEELRDAYSSGRFVIIHGDGLKIDLTAITSAPRAIIANLPYNVGTQMLINWLRHIDAYKSLTLMFQAEVVDRLVAQPKSKAYGRLSVLTQFCCEAKCVLKVPARAFTPPPKVDSAVVLLTPRLDRPADIELPALELVTHHAFGQRRKMLRASLRPLGGEELLGKAGLDPSLRAEDLPLSAYETLARLVQNKNA